MTEIVKSIEMIDDASALEEFEEQIRKKGFSVLQVGDRVLYAIGDTEKERESLNEVLEENAFVLNLDYARAKLVYLDKSTGRTADSKSLIDRFASENDVEDAGEGIQVSLLPELIEYIGENPSLVEKDISEVLNVTARPSESDSEVEEQQESTPDDDDDFIDDVGGESLDKTKKEADASEISSEVEVIEEIPDDQPQSSNETIPEEAPKKQSAAAFKAPENTKKDALMEKAEAIFDTQQHVSLPKFDELTHKELQSQLIESHFTVSKARDEGINKIYQRLKAETAESAQAIKDNVLQKARSSHEEILRNIENNYKNDVDQLLNKHNAEYEKTREEYVQSQILVIRKEYDAKQARNHQSVINFEIEKLQKKSNELMAQERARYQEYVEKVLSDSKEQVFTSVRVDDVIEAYNKVAEEQKELLLLQAKSKKQEIGLTLSEIVKERDLLKDQINDYQSKMEEQKQSEKERIESDVSAAIQAKEQKILRKNKAELDKVLEREKELLDQIEQLEIDLASEKENKESMKREYIEPAKEVAAAKEFASHPEENRQSVEKGYHDTTESTKFGKLKFIVSSALSLTFLLLFVFGVFILNDIKSEMAKSNYIDQSSYLAQLESNGRYDKAASEMEKLGYSDQRIAEMYVENGAYVKALKTDSAVLAKVYQSAAQTGENEKQILETVKNANVLDKSHENGLDVRMAILDEDTEKIIALTENPENVDADSARAAASYLIDKKSFDQADKLIKSLKDDKLAEKLFEARKAESTEKIEKLHEEIESLTKEHDEAVENGKKLKVELDKIKKDDKEAKDKKQAAIKKNSSLQEKLKKELTEKESQLAELEKQL